MEPIATSASLSADLLQSQRLEVIGRLAGAVAHDFNNLLTIINGYAEIALASVNPRDPLFESLAEIKSAGDRAAALTQQLLAFSRRQVMQPALLDLDEVLAEARGMLQRLLGQGIDLAVVAEAPAGRVNADRVQLQQVLMNLASNARDAMPSGGKLTIGTACVELGEEVRATAPHLAPGPYVRLSVTDTGTGMDQGTLEQAFEPFFTTKEKGKGTGLGLSTVYGIVRQSGGCVAARSEVGKGSTFEIYLPRADAATNAETASPGANEAPARVPPPAAGRRPSRTVLVVDDEAEIRKLLRQVLEHAGYDVVEASNGRQAVAAVDDGGVSLVITDLVMPEKEGIETIREVRKRHGQVKIIAMSGAFGGRFLRTAEILGAHATLSKPVRPERLVQTVGELLAN